MKTTMSTHVIGWWCLQISLLALVTLIILKPEREALHNVLLVAVWLLILCYTAIWLAIIAFCDDPDTASDRKMVLEAAVALKRRGRINRALGRSMSLAIVLGLAYAGFPFSAFFFGVTWFMSVVARRAIERAAEKIRVKGAG